MSKTQVVVFKFHTRRKCFCHVIPAASMHSAALPNRRYQRIYWASTAKLAARLSRVLLHTLVRFIIFTRCWSTCTDKDPSWGMVLVQAWHFSSMLSATLPGCWKMSSAVATQLTYFLLKMVMPSCSQNAESGTRRYDCSSNIRSNASGQALENAAWPYLNEQVAAQNHCSLTQFLNLQCKHQSDLTALLISDKMHWVGHWAMRWAFTNSSRWRVGQWTCSNMIVSVNGLTRQYSYLVIYDC